MHVYMHAWVHEFAETVGGRPSASPAIAILTMLGTASHRGVFRFDVDSQRSKLGWSLCLSSQVQKAMLKVKASV